MRTATFYRVATLAIVAIIVGGPEEANAQVPYPSRDIRIVLPSTPGGSPDVIARAVATRLSAVWPHRVYVENRPGASGTIGTLEVSRAPKDGYTYLSATFGQAVGPLLLTAAKYDITTDLEPVVMFGTTPSVVLMTPSTGINSIEELVKYAKANPDKLTYAHAGPASSGRLAGKAFEYLKDIKMREVSYSGAAPAYQDLIAGRVDLMVDFLSVAAPRVTSGQLKGLAVTASKRSTKLPDVPTLTEAGISDFQIGGWFGLLAPAGTPREIIMTMNSEINRLLREPELQKDLAQLDVAIMGGSPEDFRAYLVNELKQWSELINKLGMKRE